MEVVVIKAIPKKLLLHTVTHSRTPEKDRWGEEKKSIPEDEELSFVRMEPTSKIVRTKNGAEIQLAALMYYDCRNSQPRNVEFMEDDIIAFGEQKFAVQTIEPLYAETRIHHYELGLIKHV